MYSLQKRTVLPTPEILSEMQELEIFGGISPDEVHVHIAAGCYISYSGNCVAGCACSNTSNQSVENP